MKKYLKNKSLLVLVIILTVIILAVSFGPIFMKNDPASHSLGESYTHPGAAHWFGTDKFGRDIFTRVLYGGRISLLVALLSVFLSVIIGVPYGLVSGYLGGKLDALLSWFINLFMAVPQFLLILALIAILDNQSFMWVVIVISVFSWMDIARLVRNQTISIKEMDYILAEKVLGVSKRVILVRHILPNLTGPVVVAATLLAGNVILIESTLSFLGLGIQSPLASWGNIINDGRQVLISGWWISVFPGVFIIITVLCINLASEKIMEIVLKRFS